MKIDAPRAFAAGAAGALVFCAAALAQTPAAPTKPGQEIIADQIVAVVNDDVITRNELNRRSNEVTRMLVRQGTQMPPKEVLDRQVLERMIDERAQIQEARDDGVKIDDATLDQAIARIAAQDKQTLTELRKKIEGSGTTWAGFREDVRGEIAMQRLRDHEVDANVQVSESEIDNYLAEQTGGSATGYELDLGQILVRVPEQASAEQIEAARKKADDLYARLQGGADFSQTAVSSSDATDALTTGGDMGYRAQNRYPTLFVDAVAQLTPGQVAKPIKSPAGFHIIKLIGRRRGVVGPNAIAPVLQTHVRHILIRVNEVMSAEQARQRLLDIRQRVLTGTATFEDMAKSYSNDGSASRGGDLGTVYPGDTVPEFERVMNALKPGEISEPVQSPFGMHLIQVLSRSTEAVPDARLRLLARQTLRERKAEDAYAEWARSLRDRAYVELRLDER
jgi:peptidyl-prolyl cis-trans isomerase SurA